MLISKETCFVTSATGLGELFVKSFEPENPIGIIHISHGMAEHCERYNDFAQFLAENGYAVFIHDHMGHGKSVQNDELLGFFGEENGPAALVEDVKSVVETAKSKFPNLPTFVFGHSMGSFVVRSFCAKYASLVDAAVVCGTSGKNPGAAIGAKIAEMIAGKKGSMYRSTFIDKLAFGSYNKKIQNQRTNFDWLTRDEKIVDAYIADKYCGYLFTAKAYRDLFRLLDSVNTQEWYAKIPACFPLYFIAGEADPVGAYGKGVQSVVDKLRSTGHSAVDIKLYAEDRHEILNELDKETVFADVLKWLNSNLK